MGKNKKVVNSRREEAQAKRVIKIVFVSFVILALILLISFSFFGS